MKSNTREYPVKTREKKAKQTNALLVAQVFKRDWKVEKEEESLTMKVKQIQSRDP